MQEFLTNTWPKFQHGIEAAAVLHAQQVLLENCYLGKSLCPSRHWNSWRFQWRSIQGSCVSLCNGAEYSSSASKLQHGYVINKLRYSNTVHERDPLNSVSCFCGVLQTLQQNLGWQNWYRGQRGVCIFKHGDLCTVGEWKHCYNPVGMAVRCMYQLVV